MILVNEYIPTSIASDFLIVLDDSTSGRTIDATNLLSIYTLSF